MTKELRDHYQDILELDENWTAENEERDTIARKLTITVSYTSGDGTYQCPVCRKKAVFNNMNKKTVQHLAICNYETWLLIKYPRVKCPLCGIKSIIPPFTAANSRYTKDFERRILELCISSSIQKVAKDMRLNWHAVEGIKNRAINRGIKRKYQSPGKKIKNLAIDETSFRKHHVYSTIISDANSGSVIAAIPGRDAEALINWFTTQRVADFSELRSISIDMAPPYILAVKKVFPNADELLCFDRFHVMALFNKAVDSIRRKEASTYPKKENPFYKTRFEWLRNNRKTNNRPPKRRCFLELIRKPFETVKAWKIKEQAAGLWGFKQEGSAVRAWKKLIWRLAHSRNEELKKLGKTVKGHLRGILNAILLRANNGIAEARNSCIQQVKRAAYGFRNWERFNREILFQFGRLNMAF